MVINLLYLGAGFYFYLHSTKLEVAVEQADEDEVRLTGWLLTKILGDDLDTDERRQQQLARLAEAKKVLEARAQARYEAQQAEYEAKMEARAQKAAKTGRKPPGRPPTPPTAGPRDKDQYKFTDPESRIMKNANNSGFDQHYNTQMVVEHDSRLIIGHWLCNHPNDKLAALPTIDTLPPEFSTVHF